MFFDVIFDINKITNKQLLKSLLLNENHLHITSKGRNKNKSDKLFIENYTNTITHHVNLKIYGDSDGIVIFMPNKPGAM